MAGVGFDLYCRLLKQSVARLKGDEKTFRPRATVRLDFTSSGSPEEKSSSHSESFKEKGELLGAYLPESYAPETRLRIDFYRKLANALDIKELECLQEELEDRFGKLPMEGEALLLETQIRCLAEEAGIDRIETNGNSLQCRLVKAKRKSGTEAFIKVAGRFPKLTEKDSLLKLKEVTQFLKLHIHARKVE